MFFFYQKMQTAVVVVVVVVAEDTSPIPFIYFDIRYPPCGHFIRGFWVFHTTGIGLIKVIAGDIPFLVQLPISMDCLFPGKSKPEANGFLPLILLGVPVNVPLNQSIVHS